ncbi:MAG TPA: DUF1801 domain-containing protein [Ilumatobacteraceae bacterium]
MSASDEIDTYLASLPDDQRRALQRLRELIAAAAPEAIEAISYGAPAFRYRDKPLVGFAAATNHVSFFPMSAAVVSAHKDQLTEWSTSTGTIRFTEDHPLPEELVTTLVKARLKEQDVRTRRP